MHKLAIVIPAYKAVFFEQALASVANQTCKNFTLYIGDDASPGNLKPIVDLYENQIDIVYKRFDTNLGGKDLVAHWERCVDLIGNEEWIWLFSDDDIMDTHCVEEFYATLESSPGFNIYHFNVTKIDAGGGITDEFYSFPDVFSSEEFLTGSFAIAANYSVVVEYIFNKKHFMQTGRFERFDLAWGSDDATWIKLGRGNGIKTIPGAKVYWRASAFNISPNDWDGPLIERKFLAQMEFVKWAFKEIESQRLQVDYNKINKLADFFIFKAIKYRVPALSYQKVKELGSIYADFFKKGIFKTPIVLYLQSYKRYWRLKNAIKTNILRYKDVN